MDQARENCQWNLTHNPLVTLECRYNGITFYPDAGYVYGDRETTTLASVKVLRK